VVIDDLLPDTGKEESAGESPSLPTATLGGDISQESVSHAKNKTVSSRDTVSCGETVSRKDTVSHAPTVSPSVTVSSPDTVSAADTVSPDDTASLVASVEISSNCFKMDADVFDILAEFQTPYERIVYLYLYRQSYGYCRQTCFAGLKSIIDHCKFSKNVVRRALETLESKQHIKRLARVNERDLKGTTYRVFLPCEIPDIRSQTKISILQDDHSILP
jgi:hypothetical protein